MFLRKGATAVLAAALALPLLVYATVGGYARYTADDFCWAGVLRTEGFVQAQVYWYTAYSPRYAFTLLVNLIELIGPSIVPALPAAAIVVFVACLTWTFAQFGIATLRAFLLAEVAALATLQTAPDLPQSLYWQTGMLTYLLPLILASFLIGWIRRGHRAWWAPLISLVVTFVAGGLSETYLIPQNVALTLALIVFFVYRRGDTRRKTTGTHLVAALAGGVLALIVILVAPSTTERVGGTPADLWLALSASVATAAYQAGRLLRYFPFIVLLCLALPALLPNMPSFSIDRRWFMPTTLVVAITLPFCYFPSFYAQNGNPPARSLIVPGSILIGYLLFLGFALRFALREAVVERLPQTGRSVALAGLALVPIGVVVTTLPDRAEAARYAALFDAADQQIRASRDTGTTDVTIPPLPANLGENFVTADPHDWFNVCVARYYGVRSIATSAP